MSQFTNHLHVVSDTFVQSFRFVRFADFLKIFYLSVEVVLDLMDGGNSTFFRCHEQVGRVDAVFLKSHDVPMDSNVFYAGNSPTYSYLFKEMILELQTCRVGYESLLSMYLEQIFILIQRSRLAKKPTVSSHLQEEMRIARRYFQDHYNEDINIEEYALSRNMSVSYFLKKFKEVTTKSPMQYILSIRISNAVTLLESTDYNVTEISTIIGYDNPLYFSRIFKKQKGVSPSDYRKQLSERH